MEAPWEYLRDHGSVIVGTRFDSVRIGSMETARYDGRTVHVYVRRKATKEEYEAQVEGLRASPRYVGFYEISAD